MRKHNQWIMDIKTLNSFDKYRYEKYKSVGIKVENELDDDLLTQYYIYIIIHFFRKTSGSKHEPFVIQKFIHSAVCLFKRFYLVNQYGDNQHVQNALCCIYLSLKLNQVRNQSVLQLAKSWKAKKTEKFFGEDCIHFGDEGYSEKELHLIRGIGFQLGKSPLIPSIQSLTSLIKRNIKQVGYINELQKQILERIRRIYLNHQAIFIYEGPILGLAVVICTIKNIENCFNVYINFQNLVGQQFYQCIKQNEKEIYDIVTFLNNMEKYEPKQSHLKMLRDKLIRTKEKTFQIPEKKLMRD